jgi:hypothetical protein
VTAHAAEAVCDEVSICILILDQVRRADIDAMALSIGDEVRLEAVGEGADGLGLVGLEVEGVAVDVVFAGEAVEVVGDPTVPTQRVPVTFNQPRLKFAIPESLNPALATIWLSMLS